jgi:hypothetical protein
MLRKNKSTKLTSYYNAPHIQATDGKLELLIWNISNHILQMRSLPLSKPTGKSK